MSALRGGVIALALAAAGPAPAAHGGLYGVDGQNLHVERLGTSGPGVVFESGLGGDSHAWDKVAGPISGFARVILYDRAGLGQSLPLHAADPATAETVAKRLHALLDAVGVPPPWILVGHSLGGLYLQMFARTYPHDVAGLVLLDSTIAEQPPELDPLWEMEPGSAEFLEGEGMPESTRQVREAGPFPDVPLTVVAATDHGTDLHALEPVLLRFQSRLAEMSPQGRLVVAEGSGHMIQNDRPDLVIAAVRALVEQ
ncbi:pimeloyl-ACP methyl ester carboxylesterase [Amaricoccus macauensis]|uniref:Pimeloyl-ACP methyl ester carboxylesterase n=1 Tax=Amaricoccus macauensis TaxID=57001 RepID=A0A840SX26_9RHOB|nr:alpha/beta hydrolase [Amaricoccus macauensis]MBB5223773.1 pimeloyl-ACP methyl ester carboxylesterase [Amaricoccus macauensis]